MQIAARRSALGFWHRVNARGTEREWEIPSHWRITNKIIKLSHIVSSLYGWQQEHKTQKQYIRSCLLMVRYFNLVIDLRCASKQKDAHSKNIYYIHSQCNKFSLCRLTATISFFTQGKTSCDPHIAWPSFLLLLYIYIYIFFFGKSS